MEFTYDDAKLQKVVEKGHLQKVHGAKRAKLVERRLGTIESLESAAETFDLPGHWHPLSADRSGQLACDLDQPYRLILRPGDDPIPETEDGGIDWTQVHHLVVVEITNYHE